jgi:hypothetical protein
VRIELIGLVPGAQRALGMFRPTRGLRPEPGARDD